MKCTGRPFQKEVHKMKKRLFALFLALTMLLGMLPVTAAAKEEKLYGEVPMYLGYADVDYMAEQVLKEI